jgi:hypothetical protein
MGIRYQLRLHQRDDNAVFILQTTGTFASRARVENIFWQVAGNVEGAGSDGGRSLVSTDVAYWLLTE